MCWRLIEANFRSAVLRISRSPGYLTISRLPTYRLVSGAASYVCIGTCTSWVACIQSAFYVHGAYQGITPSFKVAFVTAVHWNECITIVLEAMYIIVRYQTTKYDNHGLCKSSLSALKRSSYPKVTELVPLLVVEPLVYPSVARIM